MCGIAGVHSLNGKVTVSQDTLKRMIGMLHHRGPDQCGIYLDNSVALAHARLSIIDLISGVQPIHNEDESLWIIYNGEIFNYVELKELLVAKGHQFYTTSDTEVILHLYEEKGSAFLEQLNGQFAFAIWDSRKQELFLARDRVGIRPLYYAIVDSTLIFASEIKAIFAYGVPRQTDPISLDQIFTFWTTLTPRTAFEGVLEVPPGHYLKADQYGVTIKKYWDIPLPGANDLCSLPPDKLCEHIGELLNDAVRIRLRADVPVGCYLSGGLDSSIVTTLVVRNFNSKVRTFGIRFEEPAFDEGHYQNQMVSFLNVNHSELYASNEKIGQVFEDVMWYCEKPILRTSPAPLFMLSRLVRDSGFKVVLTGEGSDEIFGGYGIFQEAKIRRFWAREPDSEKRAGLIGRLYPDIFRDTRSRYGLRMFFGRGLEKTGDPLFSHLLRWENTSRLKMFFSDQLKDLIGSYNACNQVRDSLPETYSRAEKLSQAQYLEMVIFLSNYLLSSQGDRVAMANSIEIRLPYLDYRVIEFISRVPEKWRILGLTEKHILKKSFKDILPEDIIKRSKHPYRAPIDKSFLNSHTMERILDLLSQGSLKAAGFFDVQKVEKLLQKLRTNQNLSEMDNMAFIGILSSQIIYDRFIRNFPKQNDKVVRPDLVVDRRSKENVSIKMHTKQQTKS